MRKLPIRRVVQVACIALALLSVRAARAEQRYALVIGSNPGWSQDRPLRFADSDAERVRDVLVSLGGFAPDRVTLLRDPDTAEVRSALRALAKTTRNSTEDTLVFVYYSGHADNEHLHLRGEPLSHNELQDTLRGLPATIKLAVIDACKSGAVTNKGGAPTTEFDISVVNPKLSGMVILTSSGADELSQESRALAGSVFTHHLVSGLRGAADEDGDGKITVAEAYHYAYMRTRADTAGGTTPQRPAFRYELSGQGELVLTELATPHNAAITVPRGAPQRLVILDAHEWRLVAEANRERDRDVTLALTPGSYRVKRVLSDHLEVATIDLVAGQRSDVDRARYESAPLSGGIVKGDPGGLSPPEHHEWLRAQAFGLLADGQAAPALRIFDQLLSESPNDLLAWRGRGRALVRLAEAYQRVNDHQSEHNALADALKADPSLSEDPMFAIWYQRLGEQDARAQTSANATRKLEEEIRANPRTVKRFGVGFDVISSRGSLVATATLVVHRMIFPTFGIDFGEPGLDASVEIAPFASHWSPYIGFGGHLSAAKMGLDIGNSTSTVTADGAMYNSADIWGLHGRVEVGAQYVSPRGFTTELGLAMIVFAADNNKIAEQMWPVFHFGWLW